MTPADEASGRHRAVGARLRVDGWTVEVVRAMRAVGIEPVLLKGPVVRQWLYADDPLARTYFDVDLLVGPDDRDRAEAVLRELGFTEPVPVLPGEWPEHAASWARDVDGAVVDLHRCLHGTEGVPVERVWQVVRAHLEPLQVGAVTVSTPDEVLRTLHVALHVDVKDAPGSSPRVDLDRALRLVDHATWRRSADLARELGIESEMGTRLRSVPASYALADELQLPEDDAPRPAFRWAVHEGEVSAGAYAVARVGALSGRARVHYVVRKLVPPVAFMRRWSDLARRGPLGLGLAYVVRLGWCVGRTPGALAGWWRARRAAGGLTRPSATRSSAPGEDRSRSSR